jgi:hypothetical protein
MKTIINTVALMFLTSLVATAQDWKPDTIWINETGQFAGASYSFDDDSECYPFVGFQVDNKAATTGFALQLEETTVWFDANGRKASAEVNGYEYERNAFNSIGRINDAEGKLFRSLHYRNQTLQRIGHSAGDHNVISPLTVRLDKEFNVQGILVDEAAYLFTIHKPKNRVEGFGDKDANDLYVFEFDGRNLTAVTEKKTGDVIKVSYKKVNDVETANKISGKISGTVVAIGAPYNYLKAVK